MGDENHLVHQDFVSYYSPEESQRFACKVYRYVLEGADPSVMLEQIRKDQADLAIVRIPTAQSELMQPLAAMCETAVLCDCLVIYSRDNLKVGAPGPFRNPVELRKAEISDFPLLDSLTAQIFPDYRNHYNKNPRLSHFNLVEGYQEWVRLHVTTSNKRCFIAYLDNQPCGFAAIKIDESESQWVLGGVMPNFQGIGLYRDLLRFTVKLFMDEKSPLTVFSTQLEHLAVQRVWVSEGFFLTRSYYTIHLNSVHKAT
jgi:hypothetical protein